MLKLLPCASFTFPLETVSEFIFSDFELTDAQQDHALAIERLAPRLGALRIELCPGYMSEGSFWKIYFVLLHPRLSKQEADILSTPQVRSCYRKEILFIHVLINLSLNPLCHY